MDKPRVTRVAAYGLITEADRILLCRISDQLPHHHGKWTLPGGGIEFGERPEDAVVREVREETGLLVRCDTLVDVHSANVETHDAVYHSIRILYAVTQTGGTIRSETDGTTDLCQWWSRSQPPDLVDLAEIGLALAFEG